MDARGHVAVDYLAPSISDHSALLLKDSDDLAKPGKPFRFFNYMALHSDFDDIVL
jgi:hypothetical protein